MNRAEALRWWQAGYQAGHQAAGHEHRAAARWDRLVASYRAQHAADQQAKIDALLLETIDVLARLLNGAITPATTQPELLPPAGIITAKSCQNMHTERC
jgi:hypothetical protein